MEIFSFFVYICLLIPISVSDFKEHRISNKYIKLLIFFRLAIFLVESGIAFLSKNRFESSLLINFGMDLFSAVLIFVIFSIIAIFSKNNMGFGDVKLFVTLGLYFGAGTAIEIILFSMILIIVYSLILRIIKRNIDSFPVAPFVLISLMVFYYTKLI